MSQIEKYGEFETAWCPGCGNFSILKALKKALAGLELDPHRICLVSGIGQAAKSPHYLRCNAFNGLHGRSLPAAQAIKLANPELEVIAQSGDGCHYGEGGNHFLAALRRNVDMTMLAHDNQIYGLTKGQASPTTAQGHKTKAQPNGAPSMPFNPVAMAVTMQANFVARGFAGDVEHLAGLWNRPCGTKAFPLWTFCNPACPSTKSTRTPGTRNAATSWTRTTILRIGARPCTKRRNSATPFRSAYSTPTTGPPLPTACPAGRAFWPGRNRTRRLCATSS